MVLSTPAYPPQDEPRIARKINREIVLLIGWAPAILMQLAHPLVAAGVAEHSSFRAAPVERVRRLRSTVSAMLALTFGTPEEVARAARGINAIHDRVHGTLSQSAGPFPRGAAYSAHDPELLRWVHATMLALMPRTYELYVGRLSRAEKDRYCLEASRVAPLLGMPDGYLPASLDELHAYLDHQMASGEIVVSSVARHLARELLFPAFPRAVQPLLWPSRLAAIRLLPADIREAYGFPWDARREHLWRLSVRLIRAGVGVTPSLLKHWSASRRPVLLDPSPPVRRPAQPASMRAP